MTFSSLKQVRFLLALMVILLLTAACTGAPLDVTWGSLSLYGDPTQILFSYNDRIALIDPVDGSPVELRDADGNVRLDDAGVPRVWEIRNTGGPQTRFYTTPIPTGENTLLALSYDRFAYEVDATAARILNTQGYPLESNVVANALQTDGLLYVPYSEGDLAALNPETFGEPVWTLDTEQGVWAEPLLVDGTLYVASLDHFLYAVDPATGDVRWSLDLEGALPSAPVLHDGFLYIGSFARTIYKIALDGTIAAQYTTTDWVWGTPTIAGNVLYAGDVSGWVYALSTDDLTPIWQPRDVANGAVRAAPVVVGDNIVVGSRDRNVYWLDRASGATNFQRQVAGEVLGEPLVLGPSETLAVNSSIVLIPTMSRDELVVAFTADTGERLWVYRPRA